MNWKDIQAALLKAGFDPKGIDGIPGRNTQEALRSFQKKNGLRETGDADNTTLLVLGLGGRPAPDLPWMTIITSKMGLNETRDNAALRAFLKSDGDSVGDPAEWPWCGDLVETCIALSLPTEPLPGNPYLARNWQKFGDEVGPAYGAVGVFWRGSRDGISGHVAFLIGQNSQSFRIRGGNQGNSISDVWIAKNRLLSARKPKTWGRALPALPLVSASGAVSTNEA